MKSKKLVSFLVGLLMVCSAATASAFSLQGAKDGELIYIDFIGYDFGTTYIPTDPDVDQTFVTAPDGTADSWGIGGVVDIYNQDGIQVDTLIPAGITPSDIEFVFGGLDDHDVVWNADSQSFKILSSALSDGAYLKLWYDPDGGNNAGAGAGLTDPAGDGSFWGIGDTANDILLLDMVFVSGVIEGDDTTVLSATFDQDYSGGDGKGYLDIVGGTWQDIFVNGFFLDGEADVLFEYSADPPGYEPGVLPHPDYDAGAIPWTVAIDGRAYGQAVPEPGTFVLLGLGLLGFAACGRRRLS